MAGRGAGDVSRTAVDASDDGPVPGIAAESVSRQPDTPGAASSQDRPLQGDATTVRVEAAGSGVAELRVTPNPGGTAGAVAPHAPPVHTETTASSPATADGVLSVAAGESSDAGAGVTEGIGELTEFPDGAGGTSGASVDVSGLAASISRPLASGNGDYSVQVSLHPPELGQVRALLSFQGDVLHVTLTPEHAGGFEALSDAMPALHEQLSGGGVEVNVTLGHPGDPQGSDNQGDAPGAGRSDGSDGATPVAASSLAPPSLGEPGRIHLVL
jgi:Flagellar hook-length control protein FliK